MAKIVPNKQILRTIADFDLTAATVFQIVADAHAAQARLGPFFPKVAPGMTFYFYVVRGLRGHLVTSFKTWKEATVDGLELVENTKKRLRIGYLAAEYDEFGCLRSARARGPASAEVASDNGQLVLAYPMEFFARPHEPTPESSFETWFVTVSKVGKLYRLELALPTGLDENERFCAWKQRIALGDFPLDSAPNFAGLAPPQPSPKPRVTRRGTGGKGNGPGGKTGTGGD